MKAHIICGAKTNIITSVEVSSAHDHGTNFFPALFNETAKRFNVEEVSADKAYSSYANMRLVENKGKENHSCLIVIVHITDQLNLIVGYPILQHHFQQQG